jgi:hypothetical protein
MSSVADALTLAASFEEAILDLKAIGRTTTREFVTAGRSVQSVPLCPRLKIDRWGAEYR